MNELELTIKRALIEYSDWKMCCSIEKALDDYAMKLARNYKILDKDYMELVIKDCQYSFTKDQYDYLLHIYYANYYSLQNSSEWNLEKIIADIILDKGYDEKVLGSDELKEIIDMNDCHTLDEVIDFCDDINE